MFSIALSPPFTIASSALCTSTAHIYCKYALFSALPVSLPLFSLPAFSVFSLTYAFQSSLSCVCVCVCVWRGNCSVYVLAIATDQTRTAVSLSPSLSPYLPLCFLSISLLRSLGNMFCFFFPSFCCMLLQTGSRYFLLHQRSFRVPTYSD